MQAFWFCWLVCLARSAHTQSTPADQNDREEAVTKRKSLEVPAKKRKSIRTRMLHGNTNTTVIADPKIIGGSTATVGDYMFFSSVIASSPQLCGATLVAPDILISAAHCSEAFSTGAIVGASHQGGYTYWSPGSVQVSVVSQVIYSGYVSPAENDIMIVKISPPVTGIAPATMNFDASLPSAGQSLTIIGFGQTSSSAVNTSLTLQQAQVTALTNDQCTAVFGSTISATEQVCVENTSPFATACEGDSGGPLIITGTTTQVGLASHGLPDCNGPAVYMQLSGYQTFLQTNICSLSDDPPAYLACSGQGSPVTPPTPMPTASLVASPTKRPTLAPNKPPTKAPTNPPIHEPTKRPTAPPSHHPTTLAPTPFQCVNIVNNFCVPGQQECCSNLFCVNNLCQTSVGATPQPGKTKKCQKKNKKCRKNNKCCSGKCKKKKCK